MTVWRLKPLDLNHRDWEASTYRKEVIVRAESEERARQVATNAFRTATKVTPGEKIPNNPWNQSMLVSVAEVRDEGYLEAGKEEILGPEDALGYNDA